MDAGGDGPLDERGWSRWLTERLGEPVRVDFGRSRTAPVQARAGHDDRGEHVWEIRLHGMFRRAPLEVREALVKWLRVGRRATRAGPVLDAWIHGELAKHPAKTRRLRLETSGKTHDLGRLSDALFESEFREDFVPRGDAARPRISWGRRIASKSRRSLRLGSFEPESRVVRVHPVLDQAAVPDWFVVFVLKHELLHAAIDAYRDPSGRWVHHGPEFRAREASWPEYEPAVAWERRNLARLIRSAREGTRLRPRAEDLVLPPGVTDPSPKPRREVPPVAARERRISEREERDSQRQGLLFEE
ncbi:MAG: hypothetical protein VX460_07305 [Planctomycetota bacterium]|nr:hypothetical protein [Planctomycetota bacterium]